MTRWGFNRISGASFTRSDEHGENSSPYIVLSYAYWLSHFNGDRAAVGRTIQLNKHPYTILGVVAAGVPGNGAVLRAGFLGTDD